MGWLKVEDAQGRPHGSARLPERGWGEVRLSNSNSTRADGLQLHRGRVGLDMRKSGRQWPKEWGSLGVLQNRGVVVLRDRRAHTFGNAGAGSSSGAQPTPTRNPRLTSVVVQRVPEELRRNHRLLHEHRLPFADAPGGEQPLPLPRGTNPALRGNVKRSSPRSAAGTAHLSAADEPRFGRGLEPRPGSQRRSARVPRRGGHLRAATSTL